MAWVAGIAIARWFRKSITVDKSWWEYTEFRWRWCLQQAKWVNPDYNRTRIIVACYSDSNDWRQQTFLIRINTSRTVGAVRQGCSRGNMAVVTPSSVDSRMTVTTLSHKLIVNNQFI